jgi:putative SOS response-associated peptidase YedK
MCGRYSLTRSVQEISETLKTDIPRDMNLPYYNASPGQQLAVITNDKPADLQLLHWGFPIQHAEVSRLVINAREDSIEKKPMFRQKIKNSRCIIPADGFYEWQRSAKRKQPFRFILKDNGLFCFAGLYGNFQVNENESIQAFIIITTDANFLVGQVHNRMPVILTVGNARKWLCSEIDSAHGSLLNPFNTEAMKSYKVSPRVNLSANNSPDLVDPWTDPELTLF